MWTFFSKSMNQYEKHFSFILSLLATGYSPKAQPLNSELESAELHERSGPGSASEAYASRSPRF
ncbi:hypothetical protein CDL15_Pgr026777 [Punica granatum]|uniref:Uncharacterized protein n=1 Tax=Punica granatum TaxID=22663 RepID=A0A218WLF8_PUNGR|nr:hypothetical protein CDL15_Pgr026777 [Punica granatum]